MKKTFCTLLSLGLVAVLALSGCGKTDKGSDDKKASEETTSVAAEKNETKSATLGKVEGNVYTNAYAGFGCKLDDSWMMQSAEQLQELPSAIKDSLDGTQIGELAKDIPQIVDMMAQSTTTGSAVNVVYTQLSESDRKFYESLGEEDVIDGLLQNKDMLIESYGASGIEVKSMEKTTMDFLGEQHSVCKTVGSAQGVEVYIVQLLNYRLSGEYGITVTFTSQSEAEITEMMNSFYKV